MTRLVSPIKTALKFTGPPLAHPSYLVQSFTSSLPRLPGKPRIYVLCHPACCYQLNILPPSPTPSHFSLSLSVSYFLNFWKFNHSFIAGSRIDLILNPYRVLRVEEMWVWISFLLFLIPVTGHSMYLNTWAVPLGYPPSNCRNGHPLLSKGSLLFLTSHVLF